MEGTEDLSKVLLTAAVQIIIFGIVITILYFAAYEPIKKYFYEYFQRTGKKEEQIDSKSLDENEQAKFDYVSEANKTIKKIEGKAAQVSSNIKQRIKEDEKKISESIISKAKIQTSKERDSAIDELKKEYSNLILHSKDSNVKHEGEK